MTEVHGRRSKAGLAAIGLLLTLCLAFLISSPATAQADEWTNYCNNQKLGGWNEPWPPYPFCYGAARWYSAVMGEGDQHSVCVQASDGSGMCSSGPGAWVYNTGDWEFRWERPYIVLNSGVNTYSIVHAAAWTKNP